MVKCEMCKKKVAKYKYAESITDFTHNMIKEWCKFCYIKFLKERVEQIQKHIKELEK